MTCLHGIRSDYDVIVVGARCAGAPTAMLLARAGLNVLLVDRQDRGTDTNSTHALMRAGVLQLHRWGLLPRLILKGTPPIRQTTFHYGDDELKVDIKPGHGIDALYGPRRTIFDQILVDAATESGVQVCHSLNLVGLVTDVCGRVTGAQLRSPDGEVTAVNSTIVVGADGRQSTVARLAGAKKYRVAKNCSAAVYGYYSGLKNDGYHWYYQPGTSASLIPTNHHEHCVVVSVPPDRFYGQFRNNKEAGFLDVLKENSAELAANARTSSLQGQLRGFAGIPGYFRQSWGRGWALVGDAGYFKDPLTAHGITDALRDAEVLAKAVMTGTDVALKRYQEERDALSLPFFEVTERIASFDWSVDDIKQYHLRLNAAMKTEVEHITSLSSHTPLAA